MVQPSWTAPSQTFPETRSRKWPFIMAGVVIFSLIALLIMRAATTQSQFFITINEYYANPTKYMERDVRISAFVLGDSIQFTQIDATHSTLSFEIVDDVANPTQRLKIIAHNEPLPDLLKHEAQAIIEGRISSDNTIQANPNGILLKCPTRYEEGFKQLD